MKVSPNAPCPCGSQAKLKKCCGPYHGGRPAPPHRLMRARYTAFAMGKVDFLLDTTHPEGPQAQPDRARWRAELDAYCRTTQFDGLTVLEHDVDEQAGRATVTFRAELSRDGRPLGFTECSLFLRVDGRWLYHSGDMLD